MSPLTEPTKLILKKDSVAATDTNIREVSLLLHGNQSGGQFVDSSLSPKTITKFGDAAPGSPGAGAPVYPSSNSAFGSAIAFDGTGDYLTVPDSAEFQFGNADFTIEYWIYPNNNGGWWILGKGDSASAAGSAISFYNAGTFDFYYGSSTLSLSRPPMSLNVWQHIAVVRSGIVISIYKNGVVHSSGTIGTNSINAAATRPLQIGLYSVTAFNGYIDELRITKGVARYTSNFTPPTAPFPDF